MIKELHKKKEKEKHLNADDNLSSFLADFQETFGEEAASLLENNGYEKKKKQFPVVVYY